jgi:hypothetical protein
MVLVLVKSNLARKTAQTDPASERQEYQSKPPNRVNSRSSSTTKKSQSEKKRKEKK